MDLNGYLKYILVMRYYPDIPFVKLDKLDQKLIKNNNEKILLTFNGIFKYHNNDLIKYKINIGKSPDTINTLYGTKFYCSDFIWKKLDDSFQIPIEHQIIKKNIKTFSLNSKSCTSFIVELLDNKVQDFYFESKESFDNHSLQEDIVSFLLLLK